MKILHIRFQNLNSLAGHWHIDFTNPAYGESSLFAITGPTGAGKSTLLDAVCLALYGRTPRLTKISKSSNEIMSRQTGVCFAEVEFKTVKGHFRCHWSQHRSRQHPGGELQQPKHEIADAAGGTILESRIRDVASKVEEVTGMDFDRFTRSTLLAQGGFAAFLQATPDQRAPLLEQITGTEIYSLLSIKVHELRTEEQSILTKLEQSLGHITLLSPEDEQELQKTVSCSEKHSLSLSKEGTNIRNKLAWLDRVSSLQTEIEGYDRQLQDMAEEEKKHAPRLDRLAPGLAAQKVEPVYREYNTLLASQARELAEIQQLSSNLDGLLLLQKDAEKNYLECEKNLHHAETERKTGQELIKKVQELDLRLLATKEQHLGQTEILKTLEKQHRKEAGAITDLEIKLGLHEKRKTELDIFFTQHNSDELLVENISALQLESHTLLDLHTQRIVLAKKRKEAEQEGLQKKQHMSLLAKDESSLHSQGDMISKSLHGLRTKINHILLGSGAETVETVQQDLFNSQTRKKTVQDLLTLLEEQQEQEKELAALHRKMLEEAEKELEITSEIKLYSMEISALQQKIALLEKNLFLLARIESLEEERKRLQNDTPCPLCGATVHPYSQGNVPELNVEEAKLQETKTALLALENRHTVLSQQGTICNEQQKGFTERISTAEKRLALQKKRVDELLAHLELPPIDHIGLPLLKDEEESLSKQIILLQQSSESLKQLGSNLSEAEEKAKELVTLRQNIEKDLLQAKHHIASAEQQASRLLQEEQSLCMKLESLTASLFKKLASHGISEPTVQNLTVIIDDLGKRAEEWKKKKEAAAQAASQALILASDISHKQQYLKKLTAQIRDANEQVRKSQLSFTDLEKKRIALFGSKRPEEEAERLEAATKDAHKMLEQSNRELGGSNNKITAARTLQDKLTADSKKRQQAIEQQEKSLTQILKSSPFADLDEFLKARLQELELEKLLELQKNLQDRKIQLLTLSKDRKDVLQKEKAKKICEEDSQELKHSLDNLEEKLTELQKQTGASLERLKNNTSAKEKVTEKLMAIEAQKKVVGRWNRLHMLIGSADGKKFRNFAQGLTFEMMINHANRSLQTMSDRYILVRDKAMPLDLNVIDTYQAGEIRSTRNLSGGESFLVSLSLALGLSRMSSHNIRVDSLFLDEGFGTLDEESLETALDTLSQLREDNKLIGIISHVETLKERIPLQIEIIPGPAGRSTIKGPGATQESG